MSDTIHLACTHCRSVIWVGQSCYSGEEGRLYFDDEHRAKFGEFWAAHKSHDLRLVDSNGLDTLDPSGEWQNDDEVEESPLYRIQE